MKTLFTSQNEHLLTRSQQVEISSLGLARRAPAHSAVKVFSRGQLIGIALILALIVVGFIANPLLSAQILIGSLTLFYLATLVYRFWLFYKGVQDEAMIKILDEDARAIPDEELPIYTVLIPAYREPHVGALLAHVDALEYPREKLDVRLLIEEDDDETINALRGVSISPWIKVVMVPESDPRTKPKACNFGLFGATGDFLTIYDAEDMPEPLQLRKAVLALNRADDSVACVQARLGYFNAQQNLLTKWFTLEYGIWFGNLLPGLSSLGSVIPLGGTSNHFRGSVLRELGAWDPHNVTEDADLGIRLHRAGYRVAVLDSTTLEEANSDPINWIKQRSRWYKGYLQTFLVHMRHPLRTLREIGLSGFAGLVFFIAGTPILAALNIYVWALTLMWFTGHPAWISQLFQSAVFYSGLFCMVLGNFLIVYMGVFFVRQLRKPELLGAALLAPLYWVLMALAALKAFWQLIAAPSYWEKTVHGLHLEESNEA